MSTDTIWHFDTNSTDETEQIAADIGARLRGGEVIELRSDLGGGKTTFVRGLARGASSQDAVGSPSFTISKEYFVSGENRQFVRIVHYDFYRLSDPGLMNQELAETVADQQAVVVVEWADVVEQVLPKSHVVIAIVATTENARRFEVSLPDKFTYLRGDD